jgi:hypothetical protein
MSVGVEHPRSPVKHGPRITILPTTDLGWWAVVLAAAFFPLVFAAAVVPGAAALGFVCGLAGGVAALMAIVRHRAGRDRGRRRCTPCDRRRFPARPVDQR